MRVRVYVIIFFLVFLFESIFWKTLVDGLIPAFLSVLAIYLLDSKGWIKHSIKISKEPYIIGDSKEIEYLTEEELEQRLRHGKTEES